MSSVAEIHFRAWTLGFGQEYFPVSDPYDDPSSSQVSDNNILSLWLWTWRAIFFPSFGLWHPNDLSREIIWILNLPDPIFHPHVIQKNPLIMSWRSCLNKDENKRRGGESLASGAHAECVLGAKRHFQITFPSPVLYNLVANIGKSYW